MHSGQTVRFYLRTSFYPKQCFQDSCPHIEAMATKIYQFCEMTLIDVMADFLHALGVMAVFWRSENMEFDTFLPLSLWQWQPFLLFSLNFFRARCFFNSRNDTVLFV